MKWTTPKKNDQRTRIIFAIFPRICSDGYTRWLERVFIRERYDDGYSDSGWTELEVNPIEQNTSSS